MKIKRLKMGYIVMTVFYSLSILLYGAFNLKNYFEPPYDPSAPETFDLLQTMYEGGLYAYLFVILSVIAILSVTVYKNFKNKRAQRVFLFGYVYSVLMLLSVLGTFLVQRWFQIAFGIISLLLLLFTLVILIRGRKDFDAPDAFTPVAETPARGRKVKQVNYYFMMAFMVLSYFPLIIMPYFKDIYYAIGRDTVFWDFAYNMLAYEGLIATFFYTILVVFLISAVTLLFYRKILTKRACALLGSCIVPVLAYLPLNYAFESLSSNFNTVVFRYIPSAIALVYLGITLYVLIDDRDCFET